MFRVLVVIAAITFSTNSRAEMSKADCAALRTSTATMLGSMTELTKSVDTAKSSMPSIADRAAGSSLEKPFAEFVKAHIALGVALHNYVNAGEDLSYQLQKCSR
jgi:hypothetical protein